MKIRLIQKRIYRMVSLIFVQLQLICCLQNKINLISMMQQFHLNEWKKQYKSEQEKLNQLNELSKLYNVLFLEIQNILKKCLQSLPSILLIQQIEKEIIKIESILRYLDQKQDPFIKYMQSIHFHDQFTHQIQGLLQILKTTLLTETNKIRIRNQIRKKTLSSINLGRNNRKKQYSLHDQIKKSQDRYKYAKAGQKLQALIQSQQNAEKQLSNNLKALKMKFIEKRQSLQKMVHNLISSPNKYQVTFEKKYENIEQYFNKKIDFINAYRAQPFFKYTLKANNPIQMNDQKNNINKQHSDAFLTEFNVNLKNSKPKVKKNIEQVIQEVKSKLITKFHQEKIQKFKEISTDHLIQLIQSKKKSSVSLFYETHKNFNKQMLESRTAKSSRVSTAFNTRRNQFSQNTPSIYEYDNSNLLKKIKQNIYK